jgi:hypothetical protein
MHKLTELIWNKWRSGEYCQNDFDKIITDYLSQRAEWLFQNSEMTGDVEQQRETLNQAFEIEPKEETKNCKCSCGQFYLGNKYVRLFDGVVHRKNNPCYVLSQSEPREEKIEIEKLTTINLGYTTNTKNWQSITQLANKLNEAIDKINTLSKIVDSTNRKEGV